MAAAPALVAAAAAAVVLVRTAGDDETGGLPPTLVDGSAAHGEPAGLPQGVTGVLRVRRAGDLHTPGLEACLRLVGLGELPDGTAVVERIGVDGRSLTFRDRRAARLYGCDGNGGSPRAERWCGAAVATLAGGRLLDPRLDIAGCRDPSGRAVAAAWLDPPSGATWLALERQRSREYYRVGGGLPVRVASVDAADGSSSATFTVTPYGPDGRAGRPRTIRAEVAG